MKAIIASFILQFGAFALFSLVNLDPTEKTQLGFFYTISGILSLFGAILAFGKVQWDGGVLTPKLDGLIPFIEYNDVGNALQFLQVLGGFDALIQVILTTGSAFGALPGSSDIILGVVNAMVGIVGLYVGLKFDGFSKDPLHDKLTEVNMLIFNLSHAILYLIIGLCVLS